MTLYGCANMANSVWSWWWSLAFVKTYSDTLSYQLTDGVSDLCVRYAVAKDGLQSRGWHPRRAQKCSTGSILRAMGKQVRPRLDCVWVITRWTIVILKRFLPLAICRCDASIVSRISILIMFLMPLVTQDVRCWFAGGERVHSGPLSFSHRGYGVSHTLSLSFVRSFVLSLLLSLFLLLTLKSKLTTLFSHRQGSLLELHYWRNFRRQRNWSVLAMSGCRWSRIEKGTRSFQPCDWYVSTVLYIIYVQRCMFSYICWLKIEYSPWRRNDSMSSSYFQGLIWRYQ